MEGDDIKAENQRLRMAMEERADFIQYLVEVKLNITLPEAYKEYEVWEEKQNKLDENKLSPVTFVNGLILKRFSGLR